MTFDGGHLSNTALVLLPKTLGLLFGAELGPGQARGVLGPGQPGAGDKCLWTLHQQWCPPPDQDAGGT